MRLSLYCIESILALPQFAGVTIDALEGACLACAGGAGGFPGACVNCLGDGTAWDTELEQWVEEEKERYDAFLAAQYAEEQEAEAQAAWEASLAHPYEAWDDLMP